MTVVSFMVPRRLEMLSTGNRLHRLRGVVNGELSQDHGELPHGVQQLSMAPRTPKPKKMPAEFWSWFDQVLQDRKLSDIKVAQISGFSKSVISNARREKKRMSPASVKKMADALGYPVATIYQLAGYLDESETGSVLDAELAEAWGRLGTADREEILAMIRVKVKRERAGGSQKTGR